MPKRLVVMCPAMVNRKTTILLHDKARSHVAQQTMEKITNLKFETLPHPPHYPDLSPTDYHFFLALDNFLFGKVLSNRNNPKNVFQEFVASLTSDFYQNVIQKLISCWEKCIQSKGDYFD